MPRHPRQHALDVRALARRDDAPTSWWVDCPRERFYHAALTHVPRMQGSRIGSWQNPAGGEQYCWGRDATRATQTPKFL